MPVRFAAPTRVPGRTQQIGSHAMPTKQPPRLGIGKQTQPMALGQGAYSRLAPDNVPKTNSVSAQFSEGDYRRLFTDDANGKAIVQYARLYALDIATQIVNHYAETPGDFQDHFDVATDSFVIGDINGLPSASDEWKSKYGRHKIRLRVVGSFIKLAKPPGFLVTMSIEGSFGTDSEQTFKPIVNEIVGAVQLKQSRDPSIAPPPEPATPSVAPESADRAG